MVEALAEIEVTTKLSEDNTDIQFSDTSNRMLLWHGSWLTNWDGILSQGLRIAPPEAPLIGYVFGEGFYFADMFSVSANYCYASSAAKYGVLLLSEVGLGDMNGLLSASSDADKLPSRKLRFSFFSYLLCIEKPVFSWRRMIHGIIMILDIKTQKQRHGSDFKEAQILEDAWCHCSFGKSEGATKTQGFHYCCL